MNELPPMTLLDYMVSTKENTMLKAFLPYVDKGFQPFLATYIKYTELLATIDLFKGNGSVFSNQDNLDFSEIISSLLPYMPEQERQTFEMFGNMQNMMNIMNMADEYKDLFGSMDVSSEETTDMQPDDTSDTSDNNTDNNSSDDNSSDSNTSDGNTSGSFDFSSGLSSLLTPEQQLMFEQLSSMMN